MKNFQKFEDFSSNVHLTIIFKILLRTFFAALGLEVHNLIKGFVLKLLTLIKNRSRYFILWEHIKTFPSIDLVITSLFQIQERLWDSIEWNLKLLSQKKFLFMPLLLIPPPTGWFFKQILQLLITWWIWKPNCCEDYVFFRKRRIMFNREYHFCTMFHSQNYWFLKFSDISVSNFKYV